MSAHIEITVEDRVQTLRMNRPDKKNAIDRAMYAAMAEALRRADADPEIRATLIAGVPGAFSAGNDIADFVAIATAGQPTSEVTSFIEALATGTKPIVAAVDGLAIGIGTTMLMHCDIVLASPRSVFRTPFLDLGLVPEAGSSLLGPRLMGVRRAYALLVLGEVFDADAALDADLVTRLVDADAVEAEAFAAAKALASKPPEALAIGRDLLRGPREELLERIAVELKHFGERLTSAEARAAFMAFMSKSKG
ncbi:MULTISPECIES: crotonase/enoyl-CoA hydratase family protein [unclassified Aureimonas]|uniref:crotonase/enoyl-CoA hydratase family protein n=1 Tax=unclassified Aureimonas TaxID=2615206 RepID=UPI0006F977B7|nr:MULTISPECIES: crotonase/enoyl-CoA hydratase family protein [unclassified Aureimonas]KQT65116.1 enoyl-CoA hydratase [Aureimonas sp. Leaf427]KQT76234.1 enoyl-CoA hydratase [Aureimonas sp. Leaf460]